MSTAATRAFGSATPLRHILRLVKLLVIAVVIGFLAGAIAGGIGSRIAMRIVTIIGGESIRGMLTENGNVVGEITREGTVFLILLGGVFAGIPGGLLYVLIRRWIPGTGLWKGLAYGSFLLLAFGSWPPILFLESAVIEAENVDFSIFVSPLLAIGLFALLFPLYGLVLVPIVERLDRTRGYASKHRLVNVLVYVVLAGLCLNGLVHNAEAIHGIFQFAELGAGGGQLEAGEPVRFAVRMTRNV